MSRLYWLIYGIVTALLSLMATAVFAGGPIDPSLVAQMSVGVVNEATDWGRYNYTVTNNEPEGSPEEFIVGFQITVPPGTQLEASPPQWGWEVEVDTDDDGYVNIFWSADAWYYGIAPGQAKWGFRVRVYNQDGTDLLQWAIGSVVVDVDGQTIIDGGRPAFGWIAGPWRAQ